MAKSLTVQQAIFTAGKTDRAADYRIVASSPGIAEMDLCELAAWGPAQDSLLDTGAGAMSVNFFPLPSGAFCVSRTTPASWETKGHPVERIYTHCLIVSPEVLRHFDNHPLMLLGAARHSGYLEPLDAIPARLETLELHGTAPGDAGLLAQLATEIGATSLALLVQAALTNVCLAVRGTVATTRLICGLIDCLPVDCRTSVSFSTGLRFSTQRPFDWIALPADATQQRWLSHRPGLAALDLSRTPASPNLLIHAWARLIHCALGSRRFAFLAQELTKPRADFTLADLSALGLQLLDEFDALKGKRPQATTPRQAHAAHLQFQKSAAPEATVICGPSEIVDAESPEVVERLETLDDVVFDAIQGRAAALAALEKLWPAVKQELGDSLLAESREQYIRYALSVWREPANIEGDQDPVRAVHALEVLCVLFDDVQ